MTIESNSQQGAALDSRRAARLIPNSGGNSTSTGNASGGFNQPHQKDKTMMEHNSTQLRPLNWYISRYEVCRDYLMDHHVTYIITPGLTVYRRQHYMRGGLQWFLVTSVRTVKMARHSVLADFELWLADESTAKRCKPEGLTI